MRRAVVAGAFYEGERRSLMNQLQNCFSGIPREKDEGIIGAVVPHAGYMYSGRVAASVYAKLPRADSFVILGTNHQGIGSLIAVSKEAWGTPLGEVEVDQAFVDALPKQLIDVDETAHRYEHSIEVQLPFLQYLFDKNFQFVPIAIALTDEETVREIGDDLAHTIAQIDKKVVLIASSDFSHYEPDRIAREKDGYVIEAIKELNVAKFYKRVYERNVTACGIAPIAVMLHAAKKLGATEGNVVTYATSGDITGDTQAVVGYGGIIIL
ncbi:MAG: MEMO1 family protein [Methanophagales archaeon ANME-1-THS]|nr:MAG: MEMO1 family protein [Methanophagales archaeon ANME-1-THS]